MTINGKARKEVFNELRSATTQKKDKQGYGYIEWEQYRKALDTIIGPENYADQLEGQPQVVTLPNGDAMAVCTVTISIYDDDGNLVTSRTAPGCTMYEKLKDNKNVYSWPQNVVFNAYTSAFKNAAKRLGVFQNMEDSGTVSTSDKPPVSGNSNSNRKEQKKFTLRTEGQFLVNKADGKEDVYKISVTDLKGNVKKELVIYKNKVDNQQLMRLINDVNIGAGVTKEISCSGYETTNTRYSNKPQIILRTLDGWK